MLKKIFAMVIGSLVLLSSITASTAITVDNLSLSDIDSHWAEDDITTLNRIGILTGSNSLANPDKNVTRGEFAAFISRALDLNSTDKNVFSDVSKENVFFDVINAAYNNGIITGYSDGTFRPNNNITREEIMLIISRCITSQNTKSYSFKDIPKNYKYSTELKKAVGSGIISGYSDNSFRPQNNATRAEAATMTVRLINCHGNIDKQAVKSLAESYIKNEFSNLNANKSISVGNALDEVNFKLSVSNSISQNGTNVIKKLSNLKVNIVSSNGKIAKAKATANISYAIKSNNYTAKRSYDADITLGIIEKSNGLYVYSYNMNLIYPETINLTWEVYTAPPSYAPNGVNIVSTSSFQISAENLGVESTPLSGKISFYNALTNAYVAFAKENGYDIWAMYKTDFTLSTSNEFLNNPYMRQRALEKLIEYACKYEISGINIDFENMKVSDRSLFTKHVREVTLAMHEMGLIVSADVTRKEVTSSVWSMCFDRDALNETLDYVAIMAYDEYYAGSPVAGSVASLDWTEDTIKLTLKEINNHKLILGIPFYMRYWEEKNGKVISSKAISMQTASTLANQNKAIYTYIENDGQYKLWWKDGNKICSFWLENYDTISKRVNLASKYNLAGVASWRRGLETSDIWQAIIDNLY